MPTTADGDRSVSLRADARARAERLETRVRREAGISASLLPLGAPAERELAVHEGARRQDVVELGRLQRRGEAYVVYLAPL